MTFEILYPEEKSKRPNLNHRVEPSTGPFTVDVREGRPKILDGNGQVVATIPIREDGTYNYSNLRIIVKAFENENQSRQP